MLEAFEARCLSLGIKPPSFPLLLDSTILCSYRACPQQAFRAYFQRMKSPGIDPDLHFGGCYATGLDTMRKAFYLHDYSSSESFSKGCTALTQAWGDYTPPDTKQGPHVKSWAKCLEALDTYRKFWPLEDDNLKPLHHASIPSIEYSFTSTIIDPFTDLPFIHPDTGDPLLHSGRIDMIAVTAGSTIAPLDDKTSSRMWDINWRLRNQFMGYTDQLQSQGIKTDLFLVRRMIIYKHQCTPLQEMITFPPHVLSRYREQRANTIHDMLRKWEFFKHLLLETDDEEPWRAFDYNFGDTCTAYKGCAFQELCLARDPTIHEPSFEHNSWSPVSLPPSEKAA